MEDNILNISPIDGRYSNMTEEVGQYFSEYHLIRNRIIVEIEWLKKLFSIKEFSINISKEELDKIEKISKEFDINRGKKSKRDRASNKA